MHFMKAKFSPDVTVFITARHWSIYWARLIHSVYSNSSDVSYKGVLHFPSQCLHIQCVSLTYTVCPLHIQCVPYIYSVCPLHIQCVPYIYSVSLTYTVCVPYIYSVCPLHIQCVPTAPSLKVAKLNICISFPSIPCPIYLTLIDTIW
jgi:hypothetical protein